VQAAVVSLDPIEYGVPEPRERKFFPYYLKTLAPESELKERLSKVADLIERMKTCTSTITLEDIVFELEHPLINRIESSLQPSPDCSVSMPISKKKRRLTKSSSDPHWFQWHDDHRFHWQRDLGLTWVHPSKNPDVLRKAQTNKWFRALSWRERDLVWYMYTMYPHPGDDMSAKTALEIYDDESFDPTQEISRCKWRSGALSCLTQLSMPWMRFRQRYCTGVEKLRLHGYWNPTGQQWWEDFSNHELGELAGQGFNCFITASIFVALCVYHP
jgi:hypothetical protein